MFKDRETFDRGQFVTGLGMFTISIGFFMFFADTMEGLAEYFYAVMAVAGAWCMIFSKIEVADDEYFMNEEEHGQH